MPGSACVWRSRPELEPKSVPLFAALHLNSKRTSVQSEGLRLSECMPSRLAAETIVRWFTDKTEQAAGNLTYTWLLLFSAERCLEGWSNRIRCVGGLHPGTLENNAPYLYQPFPFIVLSPLRVLPTWQGWWNHLQGESAHRAGITLLTEKKGSCEIMAGNG